VIVRHTQYGLRAASIDHEIRQLQEATHVGARIMARHRMIGVAKEGFAIFGGHAGGA
jgi:hypothetical protein